MPGMINQSAALSNFRSGVAAEPSVLPEALAIVLKAFVRLTIGDRLWAWARLAKAKLR
jgi:hypothetical protein